MSSERSKAGWASFHLRGSQHSKRIRMPDIDGGPEHAIELGLAEGLEVEVHDGRYERVEFKPTPARGPLLITDVALRRLWIVSRTPVSALEGMAGCTVRAVYYYPRENSGKYDRDRGFRHEFGEGGPRPETSWHLAYPVLRARGAGGRGWELAEGEFTIEPRGIVG